MSQISCDIAKLPEGEAKDRLKQEGTHQASVRAKGEHPLRVVKRH